ncbi:hypothetical protein DFP97_11873 [Paenibacillus prosopidis]|uniref:Uncharacterized protein n=1 Tax=Paenibacillus prosopidis TaxID=630520 RepID=A0A368VL78_9BACL|nr:hypothetical protein DFP97_11873 [Paenibacillus prosopidis]
MNFKLGMRIRNGKGLLRRSINWRCTLNSSNDTSERTSVFFCFAYRIQVYDKQYLTSVLRTIIIIIR